MRIKKYVAKSMREALVEIKNDLGESAVILKTRKMPGGAFSFGGSDIEVTAALDEEAPATRRPEAAFPPLKFDKPVGTYNRPRPSCIVDTAQPVAIRPWNPPVLEREPKWKGAPVLKRTVSDEPQYSELKEDIKKLTAMVTTAMSNGSATTEGGFAGGWSTLFKKLINAEVKHDSASAFIKVLQTGMGGAVNGEAEVRMVELLRSQFPVSGPIKCRKKAPAVVAFVGPTGAGKTTTLAKLAAHCCLGKKKKVSLITADTYRIAAIDQIRAFADIVKVELQVVFSPDEAKGALDACAGDDIVLVDTAGRSQRNGAHMQELKSLLDAIRPDEVHCVMSAATKDSDLLDTVKRYREVGANRLLFTKLDETAHVGNIFNVVAASATPVSFLTFGQSVPDDIELASPTRFVSRLWGGNAA
jgi:flagellar biosynthesis protein FlhF